MDGHRHGPGGTDAITAAGRTDSVEPATSIAELLARPLFADPLRRHDIAPITDGASVVVLAAGDRARELRERPAWITGFDHRVETPVIGARDLTRSVSTAASAHSAAGGDVGSIEVAEICAPFSHQQLILTEAIGLTPRRGLTLRRCTGREPDVLRRTGAYRLRRQAYLQRVGTAGSGSCHERAGAATESGHGDGRDGPVKHPAAVLGTGQTKYVSKRHDVSMSGLVREAIDRALADSGSTLSDIDAVVVGKAPDFFEGVMMPELFMADALGATGKPLIRVHTAGSVGGSTAVVAASLVQSGQYRRVLAVAWEKQSESNAMWALSVPVPFTKPVGAGAGGYFAPHIRAYIRRSGAPAHIGAMVAVRTGSTVPATRWPTSNSPTSLWRRCWSLRCCGIRSASARPVLFGRCRGDGDRRRGDQRPPHREGFPVAWIHATALRTEPLAYAGRDQVNPQAGRDAAAALWSAAGITSPIDEIDVAEIYVPFSWFEPMWLENLGFAPEGEGWKPPRPARPRSRGGFRSILRRRAVVESDRRLGMIRFAEAAIQVMGKAGEHQVPGARKALGHAYGGGSQYYSMWVVGSDKPPSGDDLFKPAR